MDRIELTVFFEDPFWVAVCERRHENFYEVARHVFGDEPSNPEIYNFILHELGTLNFSHPLRLENTPSGRRVNPKRRQREARRETDHPQAGTRSQAALQQQWEACKKERQAVSKLDREAAKQRKFDLKQLKRKQKHSGR